MINATYTKIRNVIRATLEATPEWPVLDPSEIDMVNRLSDFWAKDTDITVLQAIAVATDCSTGTAHTRLNSLKAKGIVDIVSSKQDRRIKFVKPSQLTIDFFNRVSSNFKKSFNLP